MAENSEVVHVVHEIVHRREAEGFECQMCGTPWIPQVPGKKPRRCPNAKCRSMRWDRTKYPNVKPPQPPAPEGGGGIPVEVSASDRGTSRRTCYQTLPVTARKRPVPVSEPRSPQHVAA